MTVSEPPILTWTWEPGPRSDVLHLIPPDPWDENLWMCGPRAELPGVSGREVEEPPTLDNWPDRGCLNCKRVYAARLHEYWPTGHLPTGPGSLKKALDPLWESERQKRGW